MRLVAQCELRAAQTRDNGEQAYFRKQAALFRRLARVKVRTRRAGIPRLAAETTTWQ